MKKFSILAAVGIVCVSCDCIFGERGVVVDAVTGQRLDSVKVVLTYSGSRQENYTDANGFVNATEIDGCGMTSSDKDYKIRFTKAGYDTLTIDQGYHNSDASEFIESDGRRTLLLKLFPDQ